MLSTSTHRFKTTMSGAIKIPVAFREKESGTPKVIEFLLDTGASSTTMNKKTLEELGYDSGWVFMNAMPNQKDVTAANIPIIASRLIIPTLAVAGTAFCNWPILIKTLRNENFPNLLGQDILRSFDIRIIYSEAYFELVKRKDPCAPKVGLKGGEICEIQELI